MAVVSYKCPYCGGELEFDPVSQKYKCPYCLAVLDELPEDAAKELIMNLAEKNMEQPPKTVKHSFKAVWIGILGICAAPIALPIALSLICVIAAVIVSVFCVFAGLFLTAVTLAGAAVIGVIGGAALLIQSLPDGLATLGFSLCCGAVGIMSVYGIFCFLKWLLYKVAQLLGKIMKGGKKNEKNI